MSKKRVITTFAAIFLSTTKNEAPEKILWSPVHVFSDESLKLKEI